MSLNVLCHERHFVHEMWICFVNLSCLVTAIVSYLSISFLHFLPFLPLDFNFPPFLHFPLLPLEPLDAEREDRFFL